MVRGLSLIAVAGLDIPVAAAALFYLIFTGACIERVRQIVRGERIVRVSSRVVLVPAPTKENDVVDHAG
jgi:hypothetical protein